MGEWVAWRNRAMIFDNAQMRQFVNSGGRPVTTARPEVLIVDDQARNLDALESMLAPLDCVLVRAETADQALLSLLKHDFAAIVLDIQMPEMSGIELATLIKKRRRSQHVPIVFLTAHLIDDRDVLKGY